MTSVYDNIKFANSEYVPQYIGSNYDVLKETGDKLDERYRRNKELTDQVQIALANQKIDPLDEPIRAARLKKIQDDINLIASSPENFENSSNAVNQMAREFATDPHLIAAKNNYEQRQKAQTMQQELRAKGFNTFDYNTNWKGTVGEDNKLNYYNADIRQDIDKNSVMKDLMGKIADSGTILDPTGKIIKLGDKDVQFFRDGNKQGVSAKRVEELSRMLLDAYKSTAAGKQDIETLTREDLAAQRTDINSPLSQEKMLNYISPETKRTYAMNEVDANILDRMIANASPQVGQVLRGDWKPIDLSDYGSSGKTAFETNGLSAGTSTGKPIINDNIQKAVTIDDSTKPTFTTTPDGKIIKRYQENGKIYEAEVKASGEEGLRKLIETNDRKLVGNVNSNEKGSTSYMWNNSKNLVGDTRSKEEYDIDYQDAIKNMGLVSTSITKPMGEQREYYQNNVIPTIESGNILSTKSGRSITWDEFIKENDLDVTNYTKETVGIRPIVGNSEFPNGGLEVQIKDKKGKIVTSIVPLTSEYTKSTELNNTLANNSINKSQDTYDSPETAIAEDLLYIPISDDEAIIPYYFTNTRPKKKGTYNVGKEISMDTKVFTVFKKVNSQGEIEEVELTDELRNQYPQLAEMERGNKQKGTSFNKWNELRLKATGELFKNTDLAGQTGRLQDYKNFIPSPY